METKEEDKDKKLEEMIVLLCEEGDLSSQKDQIIKDLKEIYEGEYRHKYSKITTIILNSTRDKEQAFMTLTQNIRTLKEIQDNKEVESIFRYFCLYCFNICWGIGVFHFCFIKY